MTTLGNTENNPIRTGGEWILHGIRHGAYTPDTLYRGIRFLPDRDPLARLQQGDVRNVPEPHSFTFQEDTAQRFAHMHNGVLRHYVLAIDGGVRGLPVGLHAESRVIGAILEFITNGQFEVLRREERSTRYGPITYIWLKQRGVL